MENILVSLEGKVITLFEESPGLVTAHKKYLKEQLAKSRKELGFVQDRSRALLQKEQRLSELIHEIESQMELLENATIQER